MEMSRSAEKNPEKSRKKSAEEAVRDLERRLQLLGERNMPAEAAPAPAPKAVSTKEVAEKKSTPVQGGKSALLARIMAAQEKAKGPPIPAATSQPFASVEPPPSYTDDLLSNDIPPPAFDVSSLPAPPTEAAPPSFDVFEQSSVKPPPTQQNISSGWNPHAPVAPPPPTMYALKAPPPPSAPAFEDLMDFHHHQAHPQVMVPPPREDSLEEIVAALEGLSPEERQTLLQEQGQIWAAIEKEKSANASAIAAAKADVFEQRSFSNAVLAVGKPAPASGGVLNIGEVSDEDFAFQIADHKLAEQLQQEEYARAEKAERERKEKAAKASTVRDGLVKKDNGWMDWLGLGSAPTSTPSAKIRSASVTPPRFAQKPQHSKEVSNTHPTGGLSQVTTGEETGLRSNSYDETDSFMHGSRVAESKPIFHCVADSITSAVTSLNSHKLTSDSEGNVHGVDSSSLLAVPKISRNRQVD